LAKVAVQCSADTFVVNQTVVLRINICGGNRHLRQARKRYRLVLINLKCKSGDQNPLCRCGKKRGETEKPNE